MTDIIVPDYTEPFTGYRSWRTLMSVDGIRLVSCTNGEIWEPGGMVGECGRGRAHRVPDETCSCGIYAFGALQAQAEQGLPAYYHYDDENVIGEVYLYGKVISGTLGYRADKAKVKSLMVASKDWRLAGPLRDVYGVPVRIGNPYREVSK